MEGKVRQVSVLIDLFQEMITAGYTVGDYSIVKCVEGLPCDAKFITGRVDEDGRVIKLVFSHPSFKEILWGQVIPEMDIVLSRTWKVKHE